MESWREELYSELYHYGVKGMHWGVINEDKVNSEPKSSKKLDPTTRLFTELMTEISSEFKSKDMSKKYLDTVKQNYIQTRDSEDTHWEYKAVTDKTLAKMDADYCCNIAYANLISTLMQNHPAEELAIDFENFEPAVNYRSVKTGKEREWAQKEYEAAENGGEVDQVKKTEELHMFDGKDDIGEQRRKELIDKYPELKDFNFEPTVDEANKMYENRNNPAPKVEKVQNESTKTETILPETKIQEKIVTENLISEKVLNEKIDSFDNSPQTKSAIDNAKSIVKNITSKVVSAAKTAVEKGKSLVSSLIKKLKR